MTGGTNPAWRWCSTGAGGIDWRSKKDSSIFLRVVGVRVGVVRVGIPEVNPFSEAYELFSAQCDIMTATAFVLSFFDSFVVCMYIIIHRISSYSSLNSITNAKVRWAVTTTVAIRPYPVA